MYINEGHMKLSKFLTSHLQQNIDTIVTILQKNLFHLVKMLQMVFNMRKVVFFLKF